MRSHVATVASGVVLAFVVTGVLLSVAAAPARPGMFLYPVRVLTQQVTGALLDTVVIAVPAAVREEDRGHPATAPASSAPTVATPTTTSTPVTAGAVDLVDPRLLVPATETVTPQDPAADEGADVPAGVADSSPPATSTAVAPATPTASDGTPALVEVGKAQGAVSTSPDTPGSRQIEAANGSGEGGGQDASSPEAHDQAPAHDDAGHDED